MDKLQQIRLPIVKEFEEFKSLFDASLQSSNPLLSEVLTYIKQRNGKMMRPILTLLMANYSVKSIILHFMLLFHWSCFIQQVWCMTMWWTKVINAADSHR